MGPVPVTDACGGALAPGATERFGIDRLTRNLSAHRAGRRAPTGPALLAEAERCHGGPLPDDVAALLVGSRGWWS